MAKNYCISFHPHFVMKQTVLQSLHENTYSFCQRVLDKSHHVKEKSFCNKICNYIFQDSETEEIHNINLPLGYIWPLDNNLTADCIPHKFLLCDNHHLSPPIDD